MSKTNDTQTDSKPKLGGTQPQIALYQKIAAREDEIFQTLFKHLASRNDNVSLGAAKTLINKILPDLKSIEVGGEMGSDGKRRSIELLVNLGRGFVPSFVPVSSTSAGGSSEQPQEVQSTDLAPQGEKDLHGDNGDSQAGTR